MEKLEEIIEYIGEDNKKDIKNAITEIEVKYKTAEKEKQILQQKNDILELESTNAKIQKQKNYIMAGGLLFSLLGFFGYRFNKVRKDRNDKKEFAEALIFAQEEERKRIARDLHDGVGQSLLLIKNQLRTTAEVTLENQQMISDTLEEVRSISRDLHPFQLDKFGLTATINDTLLKIEKSTELFITKEIEDIDKVLNPKSEIHLYRTIQEALSNIVKHAQATAAKVSIKNEANQIRVTIQDNGKGFDLELAVVTSKSLGIRTMHERISAIGGTLKIEAGASGGTVLKIVIQK
ncbi:MAG: sensor histidine kinase [Saprospiraceae bacterium]